MPETGDTRCCCCCCAICLSIPFSTPLLRSSVGCRGGRADETEEGYGRVIKLGCSGFGFGCRWLMVRSCANASLPEADCVDLMESSESSPELSSISIIGIILSFLINGEEDEEGGALLLLLPLLMGAEDGTAMELILFFFIAMVCVYI